MKHKNISNRSAELLTSFNNENIFCFTYEDAQKVFPDTKGSTLRELLSDIISAIILQCRFTVLLRSSHHGLWHTEHPLLYQINPFTPCWRPALSPNHNSTRYCAFSDQQPTKVILPWLVTTFT